MYEVSLINLKTRMRVPWTVFKSNNFSNEGREGGKLYLEKLEKYNLKQQNNNKLKHFIEHDTIPECNVKRNMYC